MGSGAAQICAVDTSPRGKIFLGRIVSVSLQIHGLRYLASKIKVPKTSGTERVTNSGDGQRWKGRKGGIPVYWGPLPPPPTPLPPHPPPFLRPPSHTHNTQHTKRTNTTNTTNTTITTNTTNTTTTNTATTTTTTTRVFPKWTSPADGQWLYAEPRGGRRAAFDATARTSDRSRWSWLQLFHHSCGGGLETNEGLRAQKTASAGPAEYFELSSDDGKPAGGERPAALLVLDPIVPQLGHELVDVPNVVSLPEFQQHSVEHNVDLPVRGGVGRGALHGSVRRDLALLGHVRHRTAMEVMRWFVDPARGFTFTREEPLPAQGGIQILGTSLRRAATVVDVRVLMQLEFQQSMPHMILRYLRFSSSSDAANIPVVPQ